jgi:hypothetical protein
LGDVEKTSNLKKGLTNINKNKTTQIMHIWPNKSITKTRSDFKLPERLKNPPKGKDPAIREAWKSEIKEFRLNQLIILDKVPKASRRETKG